MKRVLHTLTFLLLLAVSTTGQIKLKTANLQHGTYTDGTANYGGQATILSGGSTDIVGAQEVSGGDLASWDTGFATGGMTRAIYQAHIGSPGDGNAIWYRGSSVTLNTTYFHDLANGANPTSGSSTFGWDGVTDIRRTAVAGKFTKSSQSFYVVVYHACAASCEDSSNTNFASQRVDQITDLLSWVNSTLTGGLPVIVIGDFNMPSNYPRAPERTYTASAATDTLTSTAHGFTNGTAVVLRNSGGAAPGNLATGDSLYALATVYYVRDVTTNTFKLAATVGEPAIDLTTDGTGTNFASATQLGLFLSGYTDLWQYGIINSLATANWGDRDTDGLADMPLGYATQTSRTHDSRRIDFAMSTGFGLSNIDIPDLRTTCSVALTTGGNFKQCPDVTTLVDFPEDDGVRPSDHNWVTITVAIGKPKCRFHTLVRCQ